MSSERQPQRYWCHICNAEVPTFMVPDTTCQYCNEQFIEELQTEDDPREFLNGIDDEHLGGFRRDRSNVMPHTYTPLSNRFDDNSNQSEVGDDLFQFFTPSRTRRTALETEDTRFNDSPLGNVLQSMLTNIMGPENTETTTQHTEENRQQMLFFGNVLDGNIRIESMPGSMPRSNSTNSNENRENTNENARLQSIASIMRLLSNFTGTVDDEIAGNPDDYVFSQTALDNIISQLMEQTGGASAPPPAPESVIDSLVKRSLNDKEKGQEADCAVCKDEFELTEQVIVLPCDHIFHDDCIKPWLKLNGTCPVCRTTVLPKETNNEINNESHQANPSPDSSSESVSWHMSGRNLRRTQSEQDMPASWPSNSSQETSGSQYASSNNANK